MVIFIEIELRVHKGKGKIQIFKETVYDCLIVAAGSPTLVKPYLQIFEFFRVEVSTQLIVLFLNTHLFVDRIFFDLLLILVLKVLIGTFGDV
jgi:hypothetical protein